MSLARGSEKQRMGLGFNRSCSECLRTHSLQHYVKASVGMEVIRNFVTGCIYSLSKNEAVYLTAVGDSSVNARRLQTHLQRAFLDLFCYLISASSSSVVGLEK